MGLILVIVHHHLLAYNNLSISKSMKPILIASPRTGSTIIGKQISNLAEQWWGYKNYLHEYFSIGSLIKTEVKNIKGTLHCVFLGYVTEPWCENSEKERIRRRDLLDGKTEYLIKLLPGNFDSWIVDWVEDHWDPIFLERRNKLDQLLSYIAYRSTNVAHYHKHSNNVVNEFEYKWKWADEFIWALQKYYQIKSELKGPTIYYEDWFDEGADQAALIKLLNWPQKDYKLMSPLGKPTPYTNIPEYLISNKDEWNKDKSVIISRLDGCQ
jgi:hypothetical protein